MLPAICRPKKKKKKKDLNKGHVFPLYNNIFEHLVDVICSQNPTSNSSQNPKSNEFQRVTLTGIPKARHFTTGSPDSAPSRINGQRKPQLYPRRY